MIQTFYVGAPALGFQIFSKYDEMVGQELTQAIY